MPSIFSYSSAPQPIKPGKSKYRNNDGLSLSLMSDPRVIRGSTAAPGGTADIRVSTSEKKNAKDDNEHKISRRGQIGSSSRATYNYEVKKYSGDDLDLSLYLTETKTVSRPPRQAETQTDIFNERPPTPEYIPRKTGVDCATQVEDVTELFNFDLEVDPLLSVIVEKTLEQSLFEVRAESELEALGERIHELEEDAAKERSWVEQRQQEVRDQQERKRAELQEMAERKRSLLSTKMKVAGLRAMRDVMPELIADIENKLYSQGDWINPLKATIQEDLKKMIALHAMAGDARIAAEEIIDEILQSAKERYEDTEAYVRELRYVDLTIVLREDGAGGGGDGDADDTGADLVAETEAPPADPDAPPAKPFDVAAASEKGITIGPIRITEDDTLSSVESKLVVLLRDANKPDVRIRLYPYFVAARGGTPFPQDAMLVNLNLPKRLNIVI